MKKYIIVRTTTTKTHWTVEAESLEEAEKYFERDWYAGMTNEPIKLEDLDENEQHDYHAEEFENDQ